MSLIHDLAAKYCERDTGIEGCRRLDPKERWCPPCLARDELGVPVGESPRYCEECGRAVDADGVEPDGSNVCPPRRHRPHRFYHEFRKP